VTLPIWVQVEKMTDEELMQLREYIDRRLGKRSSSQVIGRRNYRDGWLQLERRRYPKSGTERGPYWYYKFVQDGKNRSLYIGKTDDPESKVDEKLREGK
jgi:hypothetical protein